jgi:hypothetical protein
MTLVGRFAPPLYRFFEITQFTLFIFCVEVNNSKVKLRVCNSGTSQGNFVDLVGGGNVILRSSCCLTTIVIDLGQLNAQVSSVDLRMDNAVTQINRTFASEDIAEYSDSNFELATAGEKRRYYLKLYVWQPFGHLPKINPYNINPILV